MLADRMGIVPEMAIFRRFGDLNTQNLLYLQAELINYEAELRKLEQRDAKDSGEKERYSSDWIKLRLSKVRGDGAQWEKFKDIRLTLQE